MISWTAFAHQRYAQKSILAMVTVMLNVTVEFATLMGGIARVPLGAPLLL